jgi:hypothetical protein
LGGLPQHLHASLLLQSGQPGWDATAAGRVRGAPQAAAPPPLPPRLRQQQLQQFAAANQLVERRLQEQDQQLADLQVRWWVPGLSCLPGLCCFL